MQFILLSIQTNSLNIIKKRYFMKKYLAVLSTLIMIGACSTAPKAGESVNQQVDPSSSEGKTLIEKFNNKKYYSINHADNTASTDLIVLNEKGELFEGAVKTPMKLYSYEGDKIVLSQALDNAGTIIGYRGVTMQATQLLGQGYKAFPTENPTTPEEIAKIYSIDNISWNTTIGDNISDATLLGKTK